MQEDSSRYNDDNIKYWRKWRQLGETVGRELQMEGRLHQGVYTMLGGPNYETVAELKMLKMCGVDAVGEGMKKLIWLVQV